MIIEMIVQKENQFFDWIKEQKSNPENTEKLLKFKSKLTRMPVNFIKFKVYFENAEQLKRETNHKIP